jgi:uncharacterized zinc-type alcohol dehydrogenase-like protein
MPTISALGVTGPTDAVGPMVIDRRDAGPHDVVIEISHCGVCHSDIHQARDEWDGSLYPMVPGHEIIGLVSATGTAVSRFEVGERVGVGCFVDSCRECENCADGEEQYCLRGNVATYNGRQRDGAPTYGGYSTSITVDEGYVLRIPDALPSVGTAPLLCAGITVYSPLKHWAVGPGKRVAILGMGGLGHVAVKIAAALGAEVTVLSHTLAKAEDGRTFGATDYLATSDPATFEVARNSFDLILNTVSSNLDIPQYLELLRRDGTLVHVGIPTEPDSFKMWSLAAGRRSVAGSSIGGIRETQEMLDFCGKHGITAETELIQPAEINDAYARVVGSDVRYRFVIDINGLR